MMVIFCLSICMCRYCLYIYFILAASTLAVYYSYSTLRFCLVWKVNNFFESCEQTCHCFFSLAYNYFAFIIVLVY